MELSAKLSEKTKEPPADIAVCSKCSWRGPVSECDTEQDGDWETGYYTQPLCPKCPDGGCIDDYDYSPEQMELHKKYQEERQQ